MRPPATCPNCGVAVPPNAKACPGCGADEHTGWAEDAQHATAADLGLPEDDFNYDEFATREFGPASAKPRGLHWVWWSAALALLAAILLTWII